MTQHHPLEDILERATDETDAESVSLGDLLELFEDRSFGPVFTVLGLLVVLPPLGAIPGLPMVIGMVVALFAFQMMLASGHPQSTGVYRKPVYFEGQGLQSAPKIARGVERDRLVRDPSPRRGDGRNGASNCGRCRRPSGPDDDAA
jgi:hypothetical protein